MTLDDWLWKNKMTTFGFCKRYDLDYQTVLSVNQRKRSPKLRLAFQIHHLTKGEVEIKSLLGKNDLLFVCAFIDKVNL